MMQVGEGKSVWIPAAGDAAVAAAAARVIAEPPALAVGSLVWIRITSIHRGRSAWERVAIVGESARLWLLDPRAFANSKYQLGGLPKRNPRLARWRRSKFGSGHAVPLAFTEEEAREAEAQATWVARAYTISRAVESCKDATKLRAIAELLGIADEIQERARG